MKRLSGPIIFFGNERLATGTTTTTPVLRGLIQDKYEIAAVVSNYTHHQSRNTRRLEIEEVAAQYNIPLMLPDKLISIKNELAEYKPSLGVLVAYGKLLPQEIIDLFPGGIINVHPSLLPKYRGSTPIEQVILDGVSKTGVSIMQLVKDMDAGPIIDQATIDLSRTETKQDLANNLLNLGKELLLKNLPNILEEKISPVIQDNDNATYTKLIEKKDGVIDWQLSATQLEHQVRAFNEWPKSRVILIDKEIVITKVKIIEAHGDPGTFASDHQHLIVYCGQQALEILELTLAGKSSISGQDFIAGYNKLIWPN
jgi:methionyl-tRNA formyltransferase